MSAPRRDRINAAVRLLAAAVGAALAVAMAAGQPITAQESPAPPTTSAPPAATTSSPESAAGDVSGLPPKSIYLRDERGNLVKVPYDATVESFLKFLPSQEAFQKFLQSQAGSRGTPAPPVASLSELELRGTADDDRATLTARITIFLQPEKADQYVRVPLGFQEAVLQKFELTGDAEAFPASPPWTREEGYAWWFKGRGAQQLLLTMTVPVRRQSPTRRLQLTLPTASVSNLHLQVPKRPVAFFTSDQTTLQTVPQADGGSACTLSGLGPRLDLTWRPVPEKSQDEGALETQTTYLCRLNPDWMYVEATQRILALQGTFSELPVQLPAGAKILKIEGREYQDHKVNVEVPEQCQVKLQTATAGPVTLKWTLRIPVDERRRLTLTGLDVARARKQTGEIGFILLEGWRLSSSESNDANLVRINAGELRAETGAAQVQRAYRFLSHPFRLPVAMDPVEPQIVVEPQLMLEVASDQLNLRGDYKLQVFRGAVTELNLQWPGWKSEGWTIEAVEPRELVESFTPADSGQPGLIRIRLTEPRRGAFDLKLRARRLLQNREETAFTLPNLAVSSPTSPILVVANAENVESELTAQEGTILRPLASHRRDEIELPRDWVNLKRSESRIDGSNRAFKIRITEHEQRIRTKSLTQAVLQNDRLELMQRIEYAVEYQRLPQVRLLSPAGLPTDRLRFFAAANVELTPAWQALQSDGTREVVLPLDEAKLGRFELQIQATLPAPDQPVDGGELVATIPILQSRDAEFTTTSFEFQRGEWQDESSPGEHWDLRLSDADNQRWTADGSRGEFPLQLVATPGGDAGPFAVGKAWVRGWVDARKSQNCRAQFRLNGHGSTLTVAMPPNTGRPRFAWGKAILSQSDATERPPGSGRFQLRLPEVAADQDEHLLTVDYVVTGDGALRGSDRVSLAAPTLQPATWVGQVVWTVELPSDQYLFDFPRQMTPMYRWERSGLFWRRTPRPDLPTLEGWMESSSGPELTAAPMPGNRYSFSQMGAPGELRIRSLSAPLVLLFGAGISLTAGFVLIQVKSARHVLSVLVLGLAFSIAGLWLMPLLELLLQPMLAGLILPFCAVLIQRWYRSRNAGTVLTLGPDSDVSYPDSFGGSRSGQGGVEFSPEDATQVRAPSAETMRYETGSGVS